MSEIQAVFCNECGRVSRHTVRAEYRQVDEDEAVVFEQLHSIMECGGCGMVTFRTRQWFSEIQDFAADPLYQYSFYPPRIEKPEPAWFAELPDEIQDVLGETHDAFYGDQRSLAAVGIRTVLDMAIVEKVGDVGTFVEKVDVLLQRALINENEADLLKKALSFGSAAAHRGYRPAREDLRVMLDITESVLGTLFLRELREAELRKAANDVSGRVPPRPKKQRKDPNRIDGAPDEGGGSNGG